MEGTPFGAGGMPVRSKLPSLWLSRVITLSPSYTCDFKNCFPTCLDISANLNSNDTLVVLAGGEGLGLLGGDGGVSLDQAAHDGALCLDAQLSGATSRRTRSATSELESPVKIAAWTAAP